MKEMSFLSATLSVPTVNTVPKPSHKSKQSKAVTSNMHDQPLGKRAGEEVSRVQSKDIRGLKYFDILLPLLERAIAQASELKKVQKKLGCKRMSLGSLSETSRVFDADRL